MLESFPIEKYVEFDNEPWFLGRIVVHKVKEHFHVEVDIVNKKSHKIFRHIASLYNFDDHRDALEMGYRELRLKAGVKTAN
jgi:hypothetical protein